MALNKESEIDKLKQQITELKSQLFQKEDLLRKLQQEDLGKKNMCMYSTGLSTDEVSRYSRQMLVPEIGFKGQMRLKKASVLIVGIGGLGCPAALYLAAAGVGTITLLDYDEVDITNLHRQILHSEESLGTPKVDSALRVLQSINSNIKIITSNTVADSKSLQDFITTNKYDVVLDGSDNVATRYLLNDICVLNKLPLVSGSALKMEGQLTVYNYNDGPCYRCLFPTPPSPNTVTNCGDGGVLGPVPGTIGVLQALETIKILTEVDGVLSGRLMIFDASTSSFLNVKLRKKMENCDICGLDPKIKELIDYEQFCGSKAHDKVIDMTIQSDIEHISALELSNLDENSVVFDVRPSAEYEFCKLPNTINLPYTQIINNKNLDEITKVLDSHKSSVSKVYFLCRRGNDSQRAIYYLKEEVYILIPNMLIHHFPYIEAVSIKMHYVEAGDPTHPLVLLLHGFPDFWLGWRHQIPVLAEEFRVVAVDLKGFGDSDKPSWRRSYRIDVILEELRQLISTFGVSGCIVVGHDLGALIGWYFAYRNPSVVDKFVAVSCPHPNIYCNISSNKWLNCVQLPYLPEIDALKQDVRIISDYHKHLPLNYLDAYKYSFSRKVDWSGPLNYYRNLPFNKISENQDEPMEVRTILITGSKDDMVSLESVVKSTDYCDRARVKIIDNAGHFPHQEKPEEFNTILMKCLRRRKTLDRSPSKGLMDKMLGAVSSTVKYGNSVLGSVHRRSVVSDLTH
ncbi:hypothetical protein WA026_004079 [Henosepilachna vigintioctopunctata]|uniref:Adenylyltransferase and sulfurtransferase MOCS3 homolog n=1 Tax=Henosepilachna vigintioctopunctata TaxID=420089 RepID=A0AAW1U8H4_9CUCU